MFQMFEAIVGQSASGRIFANTSKPYYVSGELVTGNIVAEIRMPVNASGIDLKITGYEKTEWHQKTHRTETINHGPDQPVEHKKIPQIRRHRGKRTFFQNQMRIYNIQGGCLMPGSYTFPFQYQLPDNIPGSFHEVGPMPHIEPNCEWLEDRTSYGELFYDSDEEGPMGQGFAVNLPGGGNQKRYGLLATVVYKIKVTLDLDGMFSTDLHCKIPICIHSKLNQQVAPAMQELTKPVVVCCCIDKGSCHVKAYFDKLAYTPGETANVSAEINNQSTANLGMVCMLQRTLRLKSQDLQQHNITENVVVQQFEAVPPNTNCNRPMPLPLIGDKVKPTSLGDFVNCSYQYIVKCDVNYGDDINLVMPVTIYAPQPRPVQ